MYMSADGHFAVTVAKDNDARVWYIATMSCVRVLSGHTQQVRRQRLVTPLGPRCGLLGWRTVSHAAAFFRQPLAATARVLADVSCHMRAGVCCHTHPQYGASLLDSSTIQQIAPPPLACSEQCVHSVGGCVAALRTAESTGCCRFGTLILALYACL